MPSTRPKLGLAVLKGLIGTFKAARQINPNAAQSQGIDTMEQLKWEYLTFLKKSLDLKHDKELDEASKAWAKSFLTTFLWFPVRM
jgi:hypothetical protein